MLKLGSNLHCVQPLLEYTESDVSITLEQNLFSLVSKYVSSTNYHSFFYHRQKKINSSTFEPENKILKLQHITPFADHLGEKDIHFREVWNQ